MKTRRSKIASSILTSVKAFFNGDEFRNRPEKIREYVRWALGNGGPAYFETPVPVSCTLRRDDPNYPVSSSYNRKLVLITSVRNRKASCVHNSSSRLPRLS